MTIRDRSLVAMARARRAVHDELAPLARPSACSWRVAAVYLPLAAASQWAVDVGYSDASPVGWALATVVSMAVFAVIFGGLHALVNRRPLRPAAVLAAFIVAGTARTLSVGVVAVMLDLSDSMEWSFRIAGGLLLSPALLGVIASAVSRHDAHLAVVTELQGQRDRLLHLGQSMDDALARTEEEITLTVRAAIRPALNALDNVLDRLMVDSSTQHAVDALTRLVEDDVRPISHRLATQERWRPASLERVRDTGPARVPLPARVAIADGMRPVIAALLFFSVAGPTLFRFASTGVAVVQLVEGALLSWCVLSVVKFLARPIHLATMPAVVAVAGVHAVGAGIVVPVIQDSWLPVAAGGHMAGLVVAAVVGATTMIAVAVDARRAATERELARVVAELQTLVEMMGRRARLASSRLAHVLHGSLQGALHAASIRLAEAQQPDATLVQAIRHDIAAAIERLEDRPVGGAALQHTLDELIAVWSGHRRIAVSLDAAVLDALAIDHDSDAAAAEVAREAVNNAVRHGRADSVDVHVALDDGSESDGAHRTITITVTDNGSGWPADAPRGLGSMLLDDLCTEWHHVSADHGAGTRVVARVSVLAVSTGSILA